MFASFVSRWPFLAAVALVSAAVSDVLAEAVANTGAFGPAYYDTDDSSIVPSLVVALLLATYVIGLHARAICRRAFTQRRGWLAEAARDVAARPPLRDVPVVVAMQFAALFGMETLEHVVASGHLVTGFLWLGGPIALAAVLHAAVGTIATLVACRFMRASMARFTSFVCIALDFVLCALGMRGAAAFIVRRDAGSCSHARPALVRHISGRAPPSVPQAA